MALTGVAICLAACGEPRTPAIVSSEARDSAGIRIVDNATPRLAEPWRISAEPVVAIGGDGRPEETPLDPVSVFGTRSGLIVVGDGDQSGWDAMLVYDAGGGFLRKIGGSGEGPGEFGQLWWAAPYRGDSLVAMDMRGWAVRIFDESGEFARDVAGPRWMPERHPGTFGFTPGFAEGAYSDGSFLAFPFGLLDVPEGPGRAWYVHDLVRLDPTGTSRDTLGRFPIREEHWDGREQTGYDFGATVFKVPAGTRTVIGRGRSFEYDVYDESWNLAMIVRRSHIPRSVTDADRDELFQWHVAQSERAEATHPGAVERLRESFPSRPYSETKPAYDRILADDEGRIWVEEFRWIYERALPPRPRPARWSVFDPDGVWLSTVETPARFVLSSVSGDRLYGFRVDDLDVRHIEVYALATETLEGR